MILVRQARKKNDLSIRLTGVTALTDVARSRDPAARQAHIVVGEIPATSLALIEFATSLGSARGAPICCVEMA